MTKQTWSAFTGPDLKTYLKSLGVSQLVLAGVATSVGVESNVRFAHELGFNVTLAVDAMTDTLHNSFTRIFPKLGETGHHQRHRPSAGCEPLTMTWLHYPAWFIAGAFLVNALPPLLSGVSGRACQSPFASPAGGDLSTSTANVLRSFINLAVGYLLRFRVSAFKIGALDHAINTGSGNILNASPLARRFDRLHCGNPAGKP